MGHGEEWWTYVCVGLLDLFGVGGGRCCVEVGGVELDRTFHVSMILPTFLITPRDQRTSTHPTPTIIAPTCHPILCSMPAVFTAVVVSFRYSVRVLVALAIDALRLVRSSCRAAFALVVIAVARSRSEAAAGAFIAFGAGG